MLRSSTAPPILVAAFWLVGGLATAALTAGILTAGLSGDDSATAAIGPASLLLGIAVALTGTSVTMLARAGRGAPQSFSGAITPNTLQGDAAVRVRGHLRGPVSPVPPVVALRTGGPGAPTGPDAPSPGVSALWAAAQPSAPWALPPSPVVVPAKAAWAQPAHDVTPAGRGRAPIPGAHTVRIGEPGSPASGARRGLPSRGRPLVSGAAALAAGIVFLYWLGSDESALRIAAAGLLLAAGVSAPRPDPRRGRSASPAMRLAAVAVAPIVLAWLGGALPGGLATGMGGFPVFLVALSFVGAYIVISLGMVIGRAGMGTRR